MPDDMIRQIEKLSLDAWPSLQTRHYDGWILRFSDGYTKRANSVNPLYHSTLNVGTKIDYCERIFKAKGLRSTYKLTANASPKNLDDVLSERGYIVEDTTSVQLLDMNDTSESSIESGEISEPVTDEWLNEYCSLKHMAVSDRLALSGILGKIIPPKALLLLRSNGKVIGCGMGVVESGFVGLFNLVVHEEFRNRGYGRQLVLNLLKWGMAHEARYAYLQVQLDNVRARNSFSKLGFSEIYRYWYRVKDLV